MQAGRPRRWPAYTLAVLLLGYAGGKAVFAAQGRMGFPGGPAVSAAEHERYAREMMDVATMQWLAVATGVVGALLVLATVTRVGRRAPRMPMLVVLGGLLVAIGAGATIMIVDGFVGLGVGWSWHYGIIGLAVVALLIATIRSYVLATRRVSA